MSGKMCRIENGDGFSTGVLTVAFSVYVTSTPSTENDRLKDRLSAGGPLSVGGLLSKPIWPAA